MYPSVFKILLLLLFSFLFWYKSYSQLSSLHFETYSIKSGWPRDISLAPVQDRYGYLWIGTHSGLYRYDGYSFKRYFHTAKDSNSLSSNVILCIYADKDGTIWVGTDTEGLNHLDPVTGKAKHFRFNKNDSSSISSDRIFKIFRDSKNTLWVATVGNANGINVYDDKSGKFKRINYCRAFKAGDALNAHNNTVAEIIETYDHKILFGSRDGVWVYDYALNKFNVHRNLSTDNRLYTNLVVSMKEDSKGFIWIGTWAGGLQRLSLKTGEYKNFYWFDGIKGSKNICRAIEVKSDSELWVCCVDTTFGIFNTQKETFSFFKDAYVGPWDMRLDNMHNLWICFPNETCSKLNTQRQPFAKEIVHALPLDNQPSPSVSRILLQNDSVFVVTGWSNGIYLMGKPGSIPLSENARLGSLVPDIKRDKFNNIYAIILQHDKKGLYRFRKDHFEKINFTDTDLKNKPLSCISPGDENNLWIGSPDGVFSYNASNGNINRLPNKSGVLDGCLSDDITAVFAGSSKDIWIAYNSLIGFSIYNTQKKQFSHYELDQYKPAVNTVLDMLQDKQGNTWQAGIGGITVWKYIDGKAVLIKNIEAEDGLNADRIEEMKMDSAGNIWCISAFGLNKIDATSFKVTNYASALSLFPFSNFSCIAISPSDRIFIGSGEKDEIFSFDPQDLKYNLSNNPIVISSFKIFDEEQAVDFNTSSRHIRLKYFQNYFSFDFAALSFSQSSVIEYAYMLEGFDKDWNYSNIRHYASYTNVPGGNYTFRIKIKAGDSDWQERKFNVWLHIATPWFKQWWFYTAVAAFMLAVFYAVYKYRINQLKKIHRMRIRIAGELHDEVGSTLTSIAYYSELAKMESGNNNEHVKNLLDKIGGNSRKTVSSMNEIVWFINPKNDSSAQLLQRMKIVAAELIAERNIHYEFDIAEELFRAKLTMEQRRNIYLIFKEAINNAMKYACCSRMHLSVSLQDNKLIMQITDNGKGFDENKIVNGNGLLNMQTRAKEIHASISIRSGEDNGTDICLTLPIT